MSIRAPKIQHTAAAAPPRPLMNMRPVSHSRTFTPFVAASIACHALLFLLKIDLAKVPSQDSLVHIKYHGLTEMLNNELADLPEKAPLPSGQVVEIAKPEAEKKPIETRFLSEYDSCFNKETKSEFDPLIQQRGEKLKKGSSTKEEQERSSMAKRSAAEGFDGALGKYKRGPEEEQKGLPDGKSDRNDDEIVNVGGRSIAKRFLPYNNMNDMEEMRSPSNDHLMDVEASDATRLNTNKFLYADYLNSIKRAVSKYWEPARIFNILDPLGNIYGSGQWTARIMARIRPDGVLESVELYRSSGLSFYDKDAIDTFRLASPFPSPPEELLDDDGMMRLNMGFIFDLKVNSRTRTRNRPRRGLSIEFRVAIPRSPFNNASPGDQRWESGGSETSSKKEIQLSR